MSSALPSLRIRLTALVAALCVLVLTILTASPNLHAGLHSHDADGAHAAQQSLPVTDPDHVCAVTLFASGVMALLVFCLLLLGQFVVRSALWLVGDAIAAAHPRYRLVPAHAPPAA